MSDQKIQINEMRSISNMYKDWFLDYASYVILERAIPSVDDGLKPVQRRILHSMKDMHDNRYHKVANIIGNTMKYHPHGDAAIGDALVGLGQKNLLIETQGNWGDTRTGDKAAAPRYIEAKLSDFALEVAFDKSTTIFQSSYDGRNKEPVSLPVKFPLVLAQGVEGIAVGLSTKILPHNFIELIKASISVVKEKSFKLFPDFDNGGLIDVKQYNDGRKSGRVRVRSKIEILDKQTIKISSIPYSVTTSSLIDSIVKANNLGKIKIKNIEDNTAQDVDIIIHLVKGVSPNVTIDALYAFTNCEISLSPNCCIVVENKPQFISVTELLKISTNNTINLLKAELEYNLFTLENKWHYLNLEKIFIKNKIYRKIEDCKTWDEIIDTITNEMNKFKDLFKRVITEEDILKLTEIKIKKISKYNFNKQNETIFNIENEISAIKDNISNIKQYTIEYFENLIIKYGENKKRKSTIEQFDSISARRVVVANQKLFVNRNEGFIGTVLKKDEFVSKCSSIDNVIVFLQDGRYIVTKIENKKFIGNNILYVSVWKKNEKHNIYNVVYKDGLSKISYAKRFSVTSIVRDRFYNLTQSTEGSKVLYLTSNKNSESEIVSLSLNSRSKAKNKNIEYDFANLTIKNRTSKGNILTKYPVRKITQKASGESTLGGIDIWLDENIGRLNSENVGLYLGSFNSDDKIITFYSDGSYNLTSFDFSNRYTMSEVSHVEKFNVDKVFTLLHYEGKAKKYYLKRFNIETTTLDKKFSLISDTRGSKFVLISNEPAIELSYNYRLANGDKKNYLIDVKEFVSIKGWKALGNQIVPKKRMSGFKFIIKDVAESEDHDVRIDNNNELTLF